MPSTPRSRTALALAVLTAVGGVIVLAPTLTRAQWMARLILRETSLVIAVFAGLAWVLARGAGRDDGAARVARWAAAFGLFAGLLPFLWQLSAFPDLRRFSPAEYVLAGALTPQVRVQRDVVLDAERPTLRADVYHATGPGPHPFVMMVHGGSWRGGNKGDISHPSRRLAAAGYTVVDVQYRLGPAHPFPAAVADVKCLLGRLRERAAELAVQPHQAALLGRSAGGQIALVAAYSAADARIPPACAVRDEPVQAVIGVYAPVDLVYGHDNPMRPDIVRGTQSLELYLGGAPAQAADAYRLGSPLSWLDRAVPPTLLIHGLGDHIVGIEHSRRLLAALTARGRPVRLVPVPFGEHGFDARTGGVGEQLARLEILDFLAASIGRARGRP